jgi:FHS family L-fucose permease-like MFS transporter
MSHPSLVLGVIALFFYVAVEVIAGDTIGAFAQSLGVANYTVMTSYTMICMVIGYILGIFLIPKFISQQNALVVSAVLGMLLTVAIVTGDNSSFAIADIMMVPFGGARLPDTLMLIAFLGLARGVSTNGTETYAKVFLRHQRLNFTDCRSPLNIFRGLKLLRTGSCV